MFRNQNENGHDRPPPPPPLRFGPHNATDPECSLSPVSISVRANNHQSFVRHAEWEVPCRPIAAVIHSMVGSMDGEYIINP
jgi:hypothetical protein